MKTYKYLVSIYGEYLSVLFGENEERKEITVKGRKVVIEKRRVIKEPSENSTGSGFVRVIYPDGTSENDIRIIAKSNNEERQRIGRELRVLRESKGLTAEQLAEQSGVNRTTISKLESGKWSASVDLLSKVCKPMGAKIGIIQKGGDD